MNQIPDQKSQIGAVSESWVTGNEDGMFLYCIKNNCNKCNYFSSTNLESKLSNYSVAIAFQTLCITSFLPILIKRLVKKYYFLFLHQSSSLKEPYLPIYLPTYPPTYHSPIIKQICKVNCHHLGRQIRILFSYQQIVGKRM